MKMCYFWLLPFVMLIQPVFAQKSNRQEPKYSINPSLKVNAPDTSLSFLLITDITIPGCRDNDELHETQQSIADAALQQMSFLGSSIRAGAVTQACRRTDYYYVKDTADLRTVMEIFYRDNFSDYPSNLTVRPDPAWKTYLDTLYPAAK